jgi:hypothetical protein
MKDLLGFEFCVAMAGVLVLAGGAMVLWSLFGLGTFDGDALAGLIMLLVGCWLGHWAWGNAPFTLMYC